MLAVDRDTIAYGSKQDVVTLHLDTMGFDKKPKEEYKENNIPGIISRASRNVVTITKEELVERILQGYSFVPGVCLMSEKAKKAYRGGSKQKDWKEQQIFALDFDSAIDKGVKESHMEEILSRLESLGISPFFVYSSFSDGKFVVDRNVEKFRVVFATNKVVTDRELHDKLQATLMGLFSEQIDKQCSNRNRYYNGTKLDARTYTNYEALIDAEEIVEKYWEDEFVVHTPSDSPVRKQYILDKKEKTEKSEKVDKEKEKERVYIATHKREFVPVEEYPDIYVWCQSKWRRNTRYNIEYLDKIYHEREWNQKDHRERFIFITYNCYKIIHGSRKAYAKCLEYNAGFAEPLSASVFMWALEHTDEHIEDVELWMTHGSGAFIYHQKTIVKKLELTSCEVKSVGMLKTKEKNEQADENRPLKKERDLLIEKLHNEGHSSRQIAKELKVVFGTKSKLAINDSSIRYYLRTHSGVGEISTNYNSMYYYSIQAISPEVRCLFEQQNEEEATPTLNTQQQTVLDAALSGHNLVLSGFAGTGKSYLIQQIREALESRGHAVAVCAATGVAAYNIGGSTLHRLFHIYGEEDQESPITSSLLSEIGEYQTIIVDEAGMVKAKDFRFLCEVITKVKRKFYKNIQLILVCDVLQLPPVNDMFFFQTDCYQSLGFKHYYLTESIRQQGDSEYSYYLNKVRVGEDKVLTACELNRICNRYADNRYTYIVPYKSDADRINMEHLNTLEGELIDLANNQFVKVGAKVIVTENYSRNGSMKYFNGMQGKVVEVSDNKNVLTILTTDNRTVKIHRRQVQVGGEWIKGFPISLGYAITVHKSQGMTLGGANIDPRSFAEGQLYVALSRVKSASGVHLLRPIRQEYIKVNGDALAFDSAMRMESERRIVLAL